MPLLVVFFQPSNWDVREVIVYMLINLGTGCEIRHITADKTCVTAVKSLLETDFVKG